MTQRDLKYVLDALNFKQFQCLCEFVTEAAMHAEREGDTELADLCVTVYNDLKNSKWDHA